MRYLTIILLFVSSIAYGQCDSLYFSLQKTDPSCAENDGAISVINLHGTAPFTITGTGNNLSAGSYLVGVKDACGTVITRAVTLSPYTFDFDFSIVKLPGCSGGQVTIQSTVAGTYAVVSGTDTTWSTSATFTFPHLSPYETVIVKDACGNVKTKTYNAPPEFLPFIRRVDHNLHCDMFDLFVVDYDFTAPTYCLYESNGTLVTCQLTPNFFNVPYGDYYFIVSDACFRDSIFQPNMESAGGSQLDAYNWDCNAFTMHVDGMEDTVCLYNAITNTLVSCKGQDTTSLNPHTGVKWPSGAVWDSLPYGSYYAFIYDPCTDSTFKIDSTVTYPFNFDWSAYSSCSLNQLQLSINIFSAGKGPFTMDIYYPDNSLAFHAVTPGAVLYASIPVWPGGGNLKMVMQDACGHSITDYRNEQLLELYKTVDVVQKCLGLSGASGSGDIIVKTKFNNGVRPIPTIIKANGIGVNIAANSYTFDSLYTYTFTNLPSGTYIIAYGNNGCSSFLAYDTVVIKDYIYPKQYLSITSCAGGFITLKDSVSGVGPFTYEMTSPYHYTVTQSGALNIVFGVDTVIRINIIVTDGCGNSHTATVTLGPSSCSFLRVGYYTAQNRIEERLIKVYPNPNKGRFTVSISSKKKQNYSLTIYDALGVVRKSADYNQIDKKDIQYILPKGIYFLKVNGETFKIVVQ